MRRKLFGLMVMLLVLSPALVGAVTEEDFKAKTTQNLVNLCTAPATDPHFTAAVNFCHGYLVGAYQYYVSEHTGPDSKALFCFPDPAPTRSQTIQMFIDWTKTHPEFMNEMPVETQFRFLIETWPCH